MLRQSITTASALGPGDPFDEKSRFGSILVRVLAKSGYTLGQNLSLDARGAMGDMHRVPQLLQEMKAAKVDACVVTGFPVALAAKTLDIPTVVAFGAGDPVATGLVQSFARSGWRVDMPVPQQVLNDADIDTLLQKMGGKAVP